MVPHQSNTLLSRVVDVSLQTRDDRPAFFFRIVNAKPDRMKRMKSAAWPDIQPMDAGTSLHACLEVDKENPIVGVAMDAASTLTSRSSVDASVPCIERDSA